MTACKSAVRCALLYHWPGSSWQTVCGCTRTGTRGFMHCSLCKASIPQALLPELSLCLQEVLLQGAASLQSITAATSTLAAAAAANPASYTAATAGVRLFGTCGFLASCQLHGSSHGRGEASSTCGFLAACRLADRWEAGAQLVIDGRLYTHKTCTQQVHSTGTTDDVFFHVVCCCNRWPMA